MRIGVLADIHGNRLALEAVLADLRDQAPDLVVNLGDHLSGPLEAAATADLLLSQTGWIHVRGNHDRQLVELPVEAMGPSDRAAASQITEAHRAWLRSLPLAPRAARGIVLCHGTPSNDADYLLENVSASGVSLAGSREIASRAGLTADAILCGHSHAPRFVRLDHGAVILNPGSVGLQAYRDDDHRIPHLLENGSPHARYALLDRAGGAWRAIFRAVEYDWDAAARLASRNDRPDWACALSTGYATR